MYIVMAQLNYVHETDQPEIERRHQDMIASVGVGFLFILLCRAKG